MKKVTLELPEPLLREVKVLAAERGRKLKDLMADIVQAGVDVLRPGKGKKLKRSNLPVIKSKHPAPPGKELTPERVAELLWGSGEL